jgi:hypothetical protein
MIGLLVRALADRAEEVARLESGNPPEIVPPRLAGSRDPEATGDATIAFRLKTWGPMGSTVYVVTVSEVVGRP